MILFVQYKNWRLMRSYETNNPYGIPGKVYEYFDVENGYSADLILQNGLFRRANWMKDEHGLDLLQYSNKLLKMKEFL